MNKVQRENSNRAFAAAMSLPYRPAPEKNAADYNPFEVDEVYEKYASIPLPDTSESGIENYIRQHFENELTGVSTYPIQLKLNVRALSGTLNAKNGSNKDETVQDADGYCGIKIGQKVLKIPFFIKDGEMLDPDVLEMDNQRVPYTRENLKKVIYGIEQENKKLSNNATDAGSPFLRTEKPLNPSTSNGFLSNTLNIRNTVARNNNVSLTSTAATNNILDYLLEKTASAKKLEDKDFEKIASRLTDTQKGLNRNYMRTLAVKLEKQGPLYNRQDELDFAARHNINFINANSLPNWTLIKFKEFVDNSITEVKGLVISKFVAEDKAPQKIILSEDNRVHILEPGEVFSCVKCPIDDNHFAIHDTSISKLTEGAVFTAFYKETEKLIPIFAVTDTWTITADGRSGTPTIVDTSRDGTGYNTSIPKEDNEHFNRINVNVITRKESLQKEFNAERALELSILSNGSGYILLGGDEEFSKISSSSDYHFDIITSPLTRVVPIKGVVNSMTVSEVKLALDNRLSKKIEKTAAKSKEGLVKITCLNRYDSVYDLSIRYQNTANKLFKDFKKDFKYISENEVRAILTTLKFSQDEQRQMILKARNVSTATEKIPDSATANDINLIKGGTAVNMSTEGIKKTFAKYVKPEAIVDIALTTALSTLAANTAMQYINNASKDQQGNLLSSRAINRTINKDGIFAKHGLTQSTKQAASLSRDFEKLAFEHKADDLLSYAKLATISHNFMKIAEDIADGEVYLEARAIASDIVKAKPILEKMAGDLYDEKQLGIETGDTLIPSSRVSAMINSINNLYEVASCFKE